MSCLACFHPIQVGVFVPGCWLQKAFSLSWIIQWEHPVDGAPGFETWARHLTHAQNRGLQVVYGVAPVVPPDPPAPRPPEVDPLPTTSFCFAEMVKCLNWSCSKTFNTATFSLHFQPKGFDLATTEVPGVKLSPSLCFCVFAGRENLSVWGVQ